MENMSKALIIAATVLIAIGIVSLGVFIFSIVRNGTRGNELTTEERKTFNDQFLSYIDNQMHGREAKTIIQKIISSNQNHDESKQITLKFEGEETNSPDRLSEISRQSIINNALYKIEIHFSENGLVDMIEIK